MFYVLHLFVTYLLTLPRIYEHKDFDYFISESESKRNITKLDAVKFGLHIANVVHTIQVV
jgi:hypothetical protein